MNLFQFLLQLGFWQWIGVITLFTLWALIADSIIVNICQSVINVSTIIFNRIKKEKTDQSNKN